MRGHFGDFLLWSCRQTDCLSSKWCRKSQFFAPIACELPPETDVNPWQVQLRQVDGFVGFFRGRESRDVVNFSVLGTFFFLFLLLRSLRRPSCVRACGCVCICRDCGLPLGTIFVRKVSDSPGDEDTQCAERRGSRKSVPLFRWKNL